MHAMAICMKNLLGLVCDPIAAPIEVPCIKRNAVGVANAYIFSDMALAGVRSFIPPDEVIDALIDVEKRLPVRIKVCNNRWTGMYQNSCVYTKKINAVDF